jgi:hypothetical protein
VTRGVRPWAVALALSLWGAGCSFDESANNARGCKGCAPGMCVLDYCLQTATVGSPAGSGGADGNAGMAGGESGSGGNAGEGNGTGGTGAVSNGSGGAGGECPGGAKPAAETCNAIDDDCDGQVDEALQLGSCAGEGDGACGGGVLVCEDGEQVCKPGDGTPSPEVCNGLDDDCDGTVDEGIDVDCYPDDSDGCEQQEDGSYDCVGTCTAGKRTCQEGELSDCSGFIVPRKEICGADPAEDDDCDGEVDDDCPCDADQTQQCFPGPGIANIGRCKRGTQECVDGAWGPCRGAVVARAESCANPGIDDNCDGDPDNIIVFVNIIFPVTLGDPCSLSGQKGVCASGAYACKDDEFTCVGPTAQNTETTCDGLDEDCDGHVDEVYQFATDEAHCGNCTTMCSGGDLCCSNACVDLGTKDHCSGCDPCGAGQDCCDGGCVELGTEDHCTSCAGCDDGETCCDDGCVELGTDDNCHACGDKCGADEDCCGGMCKKVGTSSDCGGCDDACGGGQTCCGGTCKSGDCSTCDPACGDDQICCAQACVAPAEEGSCPPQP